MNDKEKLIERWIKLAGLLNEEAEQSEDPAQKEIEASDNEAEPASGGHPGAVFQDEVDAFAADDKEDIDENL